MLVIHQLANAMVAQRSMAESSHFPRVGHGEDDIPATQPASPGAVAVAAGVPLQAPAAVAPSPTKAESKKLPEDIDKAILNICNGFEKNLQKRSFSIMREPSKEVEEDIKFYEAHTKDLGYTRGTRAFKSKLDFHELDEPALACRQSGVQVVINIDKGMSRRAIMHTINWICAMELAMLNKEALC
jgi:hypothetical protein